ncbi:MAG TPA: polysaccharide deacetylase family protein [Alphaproteobacteria bacterium]|nr:polysaccharide deacetylase family protein [Alphaproteobacteria bacterium]
MPALILMYHDLSDAPDQVPAGHRPYVLDTSTFRRQVQAMTATQLPTLTVVQWCSASRPPRALVLTFDDGHVSNHDAALPMLIEHRLRATFFITVGRIGTGETMDWQQIRALHAAGMEIGSHTLTHRPPATLNDAQLRYELHESRRILEDGLGAPVTSVSSPTGFFNLRMCSIAREVGYHALCCGQVGLAADHGDPFSLKRVAVKRAMTQDQFEALLRFDRGMIHRLRLRQVIRDLARKTLGLDAYLRVRRILAQRGAVR